MSTFDETLSFAEDEDAISLRAADFLEKRRFGEWNGEDQIEFDAWLAEATSHYVAYLRVEAIAVRTDQLAAVEALEFKRKFRSPAVKVRRWRFIVPILAAASIALLAALGLPLVSSLMQPPDRVDSTDVGGRTLLSFADRTQIELNTDTVMRFRMTTRERTVWLEKGEAWFHVTHDSKHPFTVVAGKHRVTDLGTEFLVRRNADNVDVTLLNGRASLSAQGVQTATLKPGDEAVATLLSLSVTHKTQQELADELAWRRGMLVFRNTPLADVVKEFNRYNTVKLVIADQSIAGVKIVANARTDDYESFLQLVQDVLKLHVDRQGSVFFISRGARAQANKTERFERDR